MDLRDFIHRALVDIAAGVADASDEVRRHGGAVGAIETYGAVAQAGVLTDDDNRPISTVEFDIALAESTAKDAKATIGVFLGAVGAGAQGGLHGEAASNSRIRFSVPLVLPMPADMPADGD